MVTYLIKGIHHISIIAYSERMTLFYKSLGFTEIYSENRNNDVVVLLEGFGIEIHLIIDPSHPQRLMNPESLGIRRISFLIDDIFLMATKFGVSDINKDWLGRGYICIKDPDGNLIEFHE